MISASSAMSVSPLIVNYEEILFVSVIKYDLTCLQNDSICQTLVYNGLQFWLETLHYNAFCLDCRYSCKDERADE